MSTTVKKKDKKRYAVGVGDLVAFHSVTAHMTGSVGEVTAVLDKNAVVVRSYGCQYDAYEGFQWVLLTYRPTGKTPDGEPMADHAFYITKVLHRATPKPPKVPKPAKVLVGPDDLIEHLSSRSEEKVLYIPGEEKPA